jgi:hypothetical protein
MLRGLLITAALAVAGAGQDRPLPDERQPVGKGQPAVQATTREGTIVSLNGNKLVLRITQQGDKAAAESTFALSPNTRVTQGARLLARGDLRSGSRVRITITGAESRVNRVEVLGKGR